MRAGDTLAEVAITQRELEQVLLGATFARAYNFQLDSFDRGECTLTVPFGDGMERPGGLIAGAVFMTAADVAMWLAIMTLLGKDPMTVTTELKTTFLSSARREDVKCSAKVLKLGKSLIYGTAECANDAGRLLTHHTVSYLRIDSGVRKL